MTMLTRMMPVLLFGAALAVAPVPAAAQAPAAQPPAKAAAKAPAAKPAAPAVVQKGPRPEQFKYEPLSFKPPQPAEFVRRFRTAWSSTSRKTTRSPGSRRR